MATNAYQQAVDDARAQLATAEQALANAVNAMNSWQQRADAWGTGPEHSESMQMAAQWRAKLPALQEEVDRLKAALATAEANLNAYRQFESQAAASGLSPAEAQAEAVRQMAAKALRRKVLIGAGIVAGVVVIVLLVIWWRKRKKA